MWNSLKFFKNLRTCIILNVYKIFFKIAFWPKILQSFAKYTRTKFSNVKILTVNPKAFLGQGFESRTISGEVFLQQ